MGWRGLRLPPWADGFKSISGSVLHARPPQKWGENQSLFPPSQLHDLSIRPSDCKGDFFVAGKAAVCSVYALMFWATQALGFAAVGILLKRDRANKTTRVCRAPFPSLCARALPTRAGGTARTAASTSGLLNIRSKKGPSIRKELGKHQKRQPSRFMFLRQVPKIPGWSHHHSTSPAPGSSSPPAPLLHHHELSPPRWL